MSGTMARPWWCEPWPWFLMALPAGAVVGGIATAVIAFRGADGVVAADYYKRGLAINEELSRSRLAAALGVAADVLIGGTEPGDLVSVRLTAAQPLPAEATLRVRLVHPGRTGADRVALLARIGAEATGRGAEYAGSWGDAAAVAGHPAWQIVIESAHWRLDGDVPIEAGAPAKTFRVAAVR